MGTYAVVQRLERAVLNQDEVCTIPSSSTITVQVQVKIFYITIVPTLHIFSHSLIQDKGLQTEHGEERRIF